MPNNLKSFECTSARSPKIIGKDTGPTLLETLSMTTAFC